VSIDANHEACPGLDETEAVMVSLWWVAVAFFVGGCSGVVLVAVMGMAARETGDSCRPRGRLHHPLSPLPLGVAACGAPTFAEAQCGTRLVATTADLACSDSAWPVYGDTP
jgi:hypothetical protein